MNYYNQYQQNHIQTASAERILILLYDGALRFIRQARQGMENQDLKAKLEGIGKAIDILNELSGTLDFDTGGEIAENLDGLYAYMVRELTLANARNDAQPLQVIDEMLVDLRDGWLQAIERVKSEKQSAAMAAPQKETRTSISFAT